MAAKLASDSKSVGYQWLPNPRYRTKGGTGRIGDLVPPGQHFLVAPHEEPVFVDFVDSVVRDYEAYYPVGMSRFTHDPAGMSSFANVSEEKGVPLQTNFSAALDDLEYVLSEKNYGGLDFNKHCSFVAHLVVRLPLGAIGTEGGKGPLCCLWGSEATENDPKEKKILVRRTDEILKKVAKLPLEGYLGLNVKEWLQTDGYIGPDTPDTPDKGLLEKSLRWLKGDEKDMYQKSRESYQEVVKEDSLGFAAGRGDLPEVQRLLQAGASPLGVGTATSDLPLVMAAVAKDNTRIADLLLEAGANMDMVSKGRMGIPPDLSIQSVAATEGQVDFFDYMVSIGADAGVVYKQKIGELSVYDWVEAKATKEGSAEPGDNQPYQGILKSLESLREGVSRSSAKSAGAGRTQDGQTDQQSM